METREALIVGGGPAGSSCARSLREGGMDVLVMDKAMFPRDKTCAGWITPEVLEVLEIAPDQYANGRTLQRITAFRTSRMGDREVDTHYERPVSFGIRRCEFDHYLLERSGASFRGGTPVERLRRLHGTWIVNEQIRTPLLIGAGGHFCPVSRALNGKPPSARTVVAQEIEFEMDVAQSAKCLINAEIPELFFCRDLKGYGWCFRKGDFLNIGLGREGPDRLPSHVREFVAFLQAKKRIPDEIPSTWHGHAYLLRSAIRRRIVGDGVLLIGDAAGLAYAESGEGIRPAVESGVQAAVAILAASGNYREEDLEPYRAQLGVPGNENVSSRDLFRWIPQRVITSIGARLLGTTWFARHVVLDRWFLRTHPARQHLAKDRLERKGRSSGQA